MARKSCVIWESAKLKLISNNPKKRTGLSGYGLEIVETIPIQIPSNPHNERYLNTKRDKLGHELQEQEWEYGKVWEYGSMGVWEYGRWE